MKRLLLQTAFLVLGLFSLQAQTVILDFESAATSTDFFYFGSGIDGTTVSAIANPDQSGINTSDSVMIHLRPGDAQTFAGAYTDPNPSTPFNLTGGNNVCVKVWLPKAGEVRLKLEQPTDGSGQTWEIGQDVTTTSSWTEICFDPSLPSATDANITAAGRTWARMVIFFDFDVAGDGTDQTYYFDDVIVAPAAPCNPILDFETPGLSTKFFYFGSGIDGTTTAAIANPDPSGINTSDSVMIHERPGDAQTFAGAFSDPNPSTPFDLSANPQICMKVWLPQAGEVRFKLEQPTDGSGQTWEVGQQVSTTNEWTEICFDPTDPSAVNGAITAAGRTWARMVIFFDFDSAGDGTAETYYFDDVCLRGSSAGDVDVDFAVDMNSYSGTFTQVYVSGSFNSFSGTANPLSDDDSDGIWTGTVNMPAGTQTYYFSVDDLAATEMLAVTDECVTTDASDNVVRRLVATSNTTLDTVCWNSCYACGEGRSITFRVGFDGVTPSPDGVFVAGGLSFGASPNRFQLTDDDSDGIYTLTINRLAGFSDFFAFTNGACPDYSCKEDISGQPCARPDNFNDRFLPPVNSDTVYSTCYALCTDNAQCWPTSIDPAANNWFDWQWGTASQQGILSFEAGITGEKEIRVLNMAGQELYRTSTSAQAVTIDLPGYSAGLYLLQVRNGEQIGTRKWMIFR